MTDLAPAAPLGGDPSLSPADTALYATTVLVWGMSWYALKLQLGSAAPEVSVFWRFVLAAAIMMGWAVMRRAPLRYSWRQHPRFAGLGLFIFSTNFTLFYYGGQHVPSGLLAVVFSLTSVVNLMLGYLFFRQTISRRVLVGGCLGVTGVALLFWPQISGVGGSIDAGALAGLGLCLAGTLSFSLGSMVSASNQKAGISVVSASAWGMAYGALFLGLFAAVRGVSFAVPMALPYLGSLVYLAIFASVVAFACYLTLIGRIGSARAGYATVLFPVVALMVSTVLEGFVWGAAALLGLGFVIAGNILVLRRGRARA
jgi:drug/metabolite transporter (DMT)-like permease